ncbi:hypothetical protein I4U23_008247 [Adineta vaga]|nr:hypothetical protein I4U23_008247 [Adineta vaga]
MIGHSLLLGLLFLLFPTNISSSINFKTACELLKLSRDCHCQRTRGVPISSLNETRLRCRQLTKITTDYQWSIVPYDRLAFETPNDNLTINRFAFANIRARTVRFNVQNLFINDHAFTNAYIGQLAISHMDTYGTLNFQLNGKVFYGTTITNIYIKLINFQTPISEIILSNSRIYTFIIQASKFYGFTNKQILPNQQNETNLVNEHQPDNFLEYDFMSTTSNSASGSSYQTSSPSSRSLKIYRQKKAKISRHSFESSDENSSQLPEQTVTMNITSNNLPVYITIYTILSSINTTNLTEHYFPNNLEYSQTDQIELSYNYIRSINAYAFRHLESFEGRLILTYNYIQYLSPYAFDNLYLLTNLSLANNSIEILTWKHFQHLEQLYELDLSYNRLEKLSNHTFRYLINLQILRLNNNPLKFIDSNVFTNLTHLKEIHLHGSQIIQNLDPLHSYWLWNLANLHLNYLLNTNFDLSDVAFCLLSHANQTMFHSPRQYACSCNVHYLYHNPSIEENHIYTPMKYHTNYLRLTPICILNETTSFFEQYSTENESIQSLDTTGFILRGLENKCDYKLMFLNCDAMTTTSTSTTSTTSTTTTTTETTTAILETISTTEINPTTTVEIFTTTMTTPWYYKYTKPPKKSVNNAKKLFTVLGTLVAITVAAIILVILWYRLKAIFKRRQKKKKIIEQQKHFNSPSDHHHQQQVTAPRYASSEMLSSIHSGQFNGNKSQSQALITPSSPSAIVYKNIDAMIGNEPSQNLNDDDENQSHQQEQEQQIEPQNVIENKMTDIQATTEC